LIQLSLQPLTCLFFYTLADWLAKGLKTCQAICKY